MAKRRFDRETFMQAIQNAGGKSVARANRADNF
jgi:hypothetical protein